MMCLLQVRVYSPANVDKALQRATIGTFIVVVVLSYLCVRVAFVASEVIVDMQKRKVTLSRIWSWYGPPALIYYYSY